MLNYPFLLPRAVTCTTPSVPPEPPARFTGIQAFRQRQIYRTLLTMRQICRIIERTNHTSPDAFAYISDRRVLRLRLAGLGPTASRFWGFRGRPLAQGHSSVIPPPSCLPARRNAPSPSSMARCASTAISSPGCRHSSGSPRRKPWPGSTSPGRSRRSRRRRPSRRSSPVSWPASPARWSS